MTRRAGVSRRVIFRGQGEVGAKLKLSTDMRLAPFNLDLLEISSYEFSWEYVWSRVKYLRNVLSEGEVHKIYLSMCLVQTKFSWWYQKS